MKLLTTAEVCELLSISKSTLFRWHGAKEDASEAIKDFPRPFRIGRALKWNEDEIKAWLENRR